MTDEDLHRTLVGQPGSRQALNTPALVLDLSALKANIARMADFAAARGFALRPHVKTHKSPHIARLQLEAGAIGLCCAKIGEAEVMAEHGLTRGLHITSPVVAPPAVQRLAALNLRTEDLSCVVDHPANIEALGEAARASRRPLAVMIDIDPGIRRTGIGSAAAALRLLDAIRHQPSLRYAGVQCYCGSHQHIEGFAARREAMVERSAYIAGIIEALVATDARPPVITGGGTGTHRIDAELGLFTELQVGSYVFMDREYLACDLTGDGGASPFETSLMVDARVVSANSPGLVTVDAGLKAFSTDAGAPIVLAGAPEGSTYRFMGDEHGAVLLPPGTSLPLASLVTFGVPHCDPTVNLYDTYHVVESDTLCAMWPVAARGRSR